MRPHFRSVFLALSFFIFFLGYSCATTPKGPNKKPYEFCYCGALKGPDNKSYCGVWADRKRLDVAHNAFDAKEQDSCTAQDCGKLFSSKCESMQMWAYPAIDYPKPSPTPCFCDTSLVESEKGLITLVCAAWMSDSTKLLEYYVSKDCNPSTCGKEPYQIAPKLCPEGFRSHYLPFPKSSKVAIPLKSMPK